MILDNLFVMLWISNMVLVLILKYEYGIKLFIYLMMWDYNLVGMYLYVMGFYKLGLYDVFVIIGDLIKVGDFFGVFLVFDLRFVELV